MDLAKRIRNLHSGYQGMDDKEAIAKEVEKLEQELSDTKEQLDLLIDKAFKTTKG